MSPLCFQLIYVNPPCFQGVFNFLNIPQLNSCCALGLALVKVRDGPRTKFARRAGAWAH